MRELGKTPAVVSNYKITKSESYSQHVLPMSVRIIVVSNYKITKSESYSQLISIPLSFLRSCI